MDSQTETNVCTVCNSRPVGMATAEVGESGNWMRGPFCAKHMSKAAQYGRVANRRQEYRGRRVPKPGWADPYDYVAPGVRPAIVRVSDVEE